MPWGRGGGNAEFLDVKLGGTYATCQWSSTRGIFLGVHGNVLPGL
jgi:hypothetical protein